MNKTIEVTALNKKGQEFYVSLTISCTKQAGELIFIAFIRDITTQKQNEHELQSQKEQLERTNQELEQFAWLASHDLKEPLRKIQTFSDLLLHKPGAIDPKFTSYLEKIQHSAFRMNNLIEDLLSYSNAAGDKEEFVTTDLNTILHDVLIDLEVTIKSKNAKIKCAPLPVAEVLPFQMRQLFQNLISNAIKFGKENTPPIIEIDCAVKGKDVAKMVVRDNGIGFKKEFSEKVFQIFQRLVSREEYEGTGIGLALCKKIIENHQGTITATSEEGAGTSFVIVLPLKHRSNQLVATNS